jgi:hypothetical protein
MNLTVEGRRDTARPSSEDIHRAIAGMALPLGPTFIILAAGEGSYIQAAGSNGRFVIESRDVYGEGFRHWRAFQPGAADGGPAVVTYRQRCPRGKHPSRGCPLAVRQSDVMSHASVMSAILQFAQDRSRSAKLEWRDISIDFLPASDADCRIRDISPRSRRPEP